LPKFAYLLACPDSFVVEEFMSDDVLRIIHELTGNDQEAGLPQFYYKLNPSSCCMRSLKAWKKDNNRYFSV